MFTGNYLYLHWRVVGKGDNNVKKVYSVQFSDSSPLQHLHHVFQQPLFPPPPPAPRTNHSRRCTLNPAHRRQTQRSKSSLLVLSDG